MPSCAIENHRRKNATLLVVSSCGLLVLSLVVAVVFWKGPFGHEETNDKYDASQQHKKCPVLVWNDEFDGPMLDTGIWEFQLGNGCDVNLCGWGNNELQSYTTENVIVSNGTLKLIAQTNQNDGFTSSRIRTIHKADFVHGRFEARIRLPQGQGIWPAFWLMPTMNIYGNWPRSGEIDVMENIGHEVSTIHGTLHYSSTNYANPHLYLTQSINIYEQFSRDFHEFAIEKRENEIRWFLDGSEYFMVTSDMILPASWPFEEQFHFILNVAIGGDWPGNPDNSTMFPQEMEVDYIRVHDLSNGVSSFGKLVGPRVVMRDQKSVLYTLENDGDDIWDSYQWKVPSGAVIAQDLMDTILVNFGNNSGTVKVEASSTICSNESKTFSISVTVGSSVDFTLVNGADTQHEKAVLVSATGIYTVVENPKVTQQQGSVNLSEKVVQYRRNGGVLYDSIIYSTFAITNPDDYVDGNRKFSLDVLTKEALTGTTFVIIQLENSERANAGNYPIGRHSRFQAMLVIGKAHESSWTKLLFNLLDQPDPSETVVDTIVILFHPNSLTDDTYYFDNLESISI